MTRLQEKVLLLTMRRGGIISAARKDNEWQEPTLEEEEALNDAFDQAEDVLARILDSAERSHQLLMDSRREVRAATDILRWSNQFAAERKASGV